MAEGIEKALTGIRGFDEISMGGLPALRTTLVCGNAGSGKTVFAMQFLLNGAKIYNEPGVFVSFEESDRQLRTNISTMGYDVEQLEREGKIQIDYVKVERSEIEETGQYDLDGLFIRLGYAIDSIGAKRVVLDTIETLFSSFQNDSVLRAEFRRLFQFLRDKGVTTVLTGERTGKSLTRYGLEEYVADCVVLMEHGVKNQIASRCMRIIKYRGTTHGTNEYPFNIGRKGISLIPITSLLLEHKALREYISTGIPALDTILDGKGYYRGSSILLSGNPGSGKTTVAVSFLNAGCQRGEKCLMFSYEESQEEIIRNMLSVGIDIRPWIEKELLHIISHRPSFEGLEMHLVWIHEMIDEIKPALVAIDPISSFSDLGIDCQVRSMLSRIVNYLKGEGATAIFTDLLPVRDNGTNMETLISSVCDTWLLVRNDIHSEYRRSLSVIKAKGMKHSDIFHELAISNNGIILKDENN